jgi:hypothetical protein
MVNSPSGAAMRHGRVGQRAVKPRRRLSWRASGSATAITDARSWNVKPASAGMPYVSWSLIHPILGAGSVAARDDVRAAPVDLPS